MWSEDGLFIGDLGSGRGEGIATWEFLGDDCHACPSRYAVHFFLWDAVAAEFPTKPSMTIRTTERFRDGVSAIRSLRLPFGDIRKQFKLLDGFW